MRWLIVYSKSNHPTEYFLTHDWLSMAQREARLLEEVGFITKIVQSFDV